MSLPKMKLRKILVDTPIIQGGMGIGYSNYILAGNVAKNGGLGVLSSAALDRMVGQRHGKKMNQRTAAAQDVRDAKEVGGGKPIGMNVMVYLGNAYEQSVLGSMDGGVDAIISGAGLPMTLPIIANTHPRADEVALIPIASSGRAFDLICKRWIKNADRLPDAVIVEGPKAGGHLAWRKLEEAQDPKNELSLLVKEVLEVAKKYGDIPVIAAGGVWSKEDIQIYLDMGCVGVQMGTRFLATHESGASDTYKQFLIEAGDDDIELATEPGSPSGLLFRVLNKSPFYIQAVNKERELLCNKGYCLKKGQCKAKVDKAAFCICNGLLSASGFAEDELELYTVGSVAAQVDKIYSVKELMSELCD